MLWALTGVLAGGIVTVPFLVLLARVRRGGRASVAAGIGCVLVSFLALTLCMLMVAAKDADGILPFGTAASMTLLVVVAVAGILTWRQVRRD